MHHSTVLAVSISLLAAGAAGGQIRTSTATRQGLVVNDQWNWLSSADVFETKAGTAVSMQLTVHVPRLGGSLLDLVSQTLSTKEAVVAKTQLVGVDVNGKPVISSSLAKPRIQEIHLPAVDASNRNPVAFAVKFFPAIETDAAAPTTLAPSATVQESQAMLASNFSFATDSIWRTAFSVDSMVVASPAPGVWTMPTLAVVVRSDAATANALQKWLASGLPKDGTLTFLSPNLATPLLIERFYGLRVQSMATVPEPANAVQRMKVTMTMTGIRLGTTATALR